MGFNYIYDYYMFYPRVQQDYYGIEHGYYPLMEILELYGYVPLINIAYVTPGSSNIINEALYTPKSYAPFPIDPYGINPAYVTLPKGYMQSYGGSVANIGSTIRYNSYRCSLNMLEVHDNGYL